MKYFICRKFQPKKSPLCRYCEYGKPHPGDECQDHDPPPCEDLLVQCVEDEELETIDPY